MTQNWLTFAAASNNFLALSMKKVMIHTDGSCLGNPGPGGWAAVLTLLGTPHRKEISGGFRLTTNNRMELMAPIQALKCLKETCEVIITTDSQYLCNALAKGWLKNWRARGWLKKNGKSLPNSDLWKTLSSLLDIHPAQFVWIKGHSGHEENERCDALARQAARLDNLPDDPGYKPDLP